MKTSFEQLYRTHYARVRGLCRHLLGRAAPADDAAQEVFMRAYRAFDKYDSKQPFAPWIMRIASNHCVDIVRRRAHEKRLFAAAAAEPAELADDEPGALAALLDDERIDGLRTAVAALPEKYRIPLVLAYYRESSYDEIAETLGVTRNHVGILILRAKRKLRDALAADLRGDTP